ncbi:hypothetical protein GBAR_LOCUS25839, partial [Geodia barretti]
NTSHRFIKRVSNSSYNGYGVGLSICKTSESVTHSVSTTDSLTTTAASSSVGDGVASDTIQRIRRSPGHCDTSGTILDCCHISGRRGT